MLLLHLEIKWIRNTRQKYQRLTIEDLEEWMKLIIWAAEEEVSSKAEAEVVTVEEVYVAAEEDYMVDVDKEADMAEEAGKNRGIKGPDLMPEWYNVTMARR